MKKITSLQILMIMGLSLSASSTFCSSDDIDMQEAVAFELQSAQTEQARLEVLTDLAESYPEQVELIIQNEADLESTFDSIRKFINNKNKEIEQLSQQNVVNEEEIARLAIELADAQAMFENTIAKHRAKNKRKSKQEQTIKDALMKAGQGLKSLSNKVAGGLNGFGNAVVKKSDKELSKLASKKVRNKKAKKSARAEQVDVLVEDPMDSADEAIAMMDDQLASDEVVVQSRGTSSGGSHKKMGARHRRN